MQARERLHLYACLLGAKARVCRTLATSLCGWWFGGVRWFGSTCARTDQPWTEGHTSHCCTNRSHSVTGHRFSTSTPVSQTGSSSPEGNGAGASPNSTPVQSGGGAAVAGGGAVRHPTQCVGPCPMEGEHAARSGSGVGRCARGHAHEWHDRAGDGGGGTEAPLGDERGGLPRHGGEDPVPREIHQADEDLRGRETVPFGVLFGCPPPLGRSTSAVLGYGRAG